MQCCSESSSEGSSEGSSACVYAACTAYILTFVLPIASSCSFSCLLIFLNLVLTHHSNRERQVASEDLDPRRQQRLGPFRQPRGSGQTMGRRGMRDGGGYMCGEILLVNGSYGGENDG